MKLLIVTQAVDIQDPVLGFFVRWIEEFSKQVERIEVICLREGEHSLPQNVRVHSLGKERGRPLFGAFSYVARFKWLAWKLRNEHDTVFVHMNPEYLVIAGWFWRLLGKRIVLWYTHRQVNVKLRVAVFFAQVVCTASKESFRLSTKKARVMGHGIDTDFFSLDSSVVRTTDVLSAGRLSPTKRHDLIIRAAAQLENRLRIIGDGPERIRLERLAQELSVSKRVEFLGAGTQGILREAYRSTSVLAHASETGSLDKVVLEALACGLPVVTTANLPGLPVTHVAATPEALAEGIRGLPPADSEALHAYVEEQHSLRRLIPALVEILRTA